MNSTKKIQGFLFLFLCGLLSFQAVSAQTYIRYIKPEDIGTKVLYADSVLTSITLPRGVGRLTNYPQINAAAYELNRVLQDPAKKVMQVWVCGSTSPDGLWADNVYLSRMRTESAASYLMAVTGIPEHMIHKESLNEDWNRLEELILDSDIPYKWEVLHIIRTMDWGVRKTALQKLDNGRVWRMLEREFFPELRCVRFAIYCKWDPSKPHLSAPVEEAYRPVSASYVPSSQKDTVYVRDTVYVIHETVHLTAPVAEPVVVTPPVSPQVTKEQVYEQYREKSIKEKPVKEKKYWDTPWRIGLKTNVLADAMVIPMGGLEFQLGSRVSLDLQGWRTEFNVFNRNDSNANVYGFTPEIRLWMKDRAMERGSFFGIHGRVAWYTLQWNDGYLYQNGYADDFATDAGNKNPAWSVGLTYGYAFALDKKAHWGLELVLGVGYGEYAQNLGIYNETKNSWDFHKHQNDAHIGITRAGINLTYRFSVRRVKPEYYER